jgi:putative endonuclease
MKFYTYILRSSKNGKHYIGQTANLKKRMREHNSGLVRSSKHDAPYNLIHYEEYNTRTEAIKGENYFKSAAGWKELNLIKQGSRGFPEGIT